ncbi:peptidase [Tianweitania sp. Rool2]|uniref:Peptidase n=2 Tax=Oryzicola mucosus TaxID=2767425 RepID=A0A8J6U7C0_9HYPH|nr:Kazal-type serine protease inhibitor [Oryzicola mucosus]MBD0414567.1 peptidase [Oryzicola mucosus]
MRPNLRTIVRTGAVAFSLSMVLAGCTVVVDEGQGPGPRPPRPGPGPQFCTREYQPVCGERRGDRTTFANPCEADRAGFRIVHGGQCRGGGIRPGPGPWPGPSPFPGPRPPRPEPAPQFCTREYRPVCAQRGRSLQTFGNACEADAAGFRVIDRGPC